MDQPDPSVHRSPNGSAAADSSIAVQDSGVPVEAACVCPPLFPPPGYGRMAAADCARKPARHPGIRQAARSTRAYLAIAGLCIAFTELYALFGHGVRSAAMNFMFLYPLLGGALPFLLRWRLICASTHSRPAVRPRIDRLAFNAYNSGIAALTVASLLTGVFEIAGTSDPYISWFRVAGALMMIGSLARIWLVRSVGQQPTHGRTTGGDASLHKPDRV